ncbi:MAG: type II toxin-antitoxin system RelE/ParE family toxin [Deltaproteobacteria bacterium]|nr:type II toxin-antitoxin system RelE/ParE family toxin [Deltaproteobacteria bacterium]
MTTKRARRRGPGRPLAVVWTDRASADLEAIGDFIASDSPAAAAQWAGELMAAAERAASAPLAGRRVPELGRDDLREIFKRTYRIVYRVTTEHIEILTVFEGHRWFPRDVARDDK